MKGWTPESTVRLGWFVKIESMQEVESDIGRSMKKDDKLLTFHVRVEIKTSKSWIYFTILFS